MNCLLYTSAPADDGAASSDKVIKIGVFEPITGENGGGGFQEVLGVRYANQVVPTVDTVSYTHLDVYKRQCMGITITFGSYLKKQEDIPKNCLLVAGLDTMMALCAGLAIFPAVFSFGLEPTQGASLVFGTLPKVFDALGGGVIFAILFFILLFFAALTRCV